MTMFENLTKGFIKENPVLVLALGLCPSLAVTTSIENGLGMGMASTAVLMGSSSIVSLLKKFIPSSIRIPIYIVIIATFVTIIDLTLQAYIPALSESLGLFIPLIVVNCIILGRAEAFASKNSLLDSLIDALGMGLGFTLALVLISSLREFAGTGAIYGYPIFQMMGLDFKGSIMMILPPGGFLAMGLILGFMQWNRMRKKIKGGK
ncbi:MAG: electron transport complex subunit RsxE [Candidatus Cloacimonadota bacterium]|nr:MAG: electron transport complex subunit RsxE [Candidatus Cloacimonadota bacterium]PIE80645.1 MAG: electron transport complex subunit RsxE [Candidatus Delongbacteria bacterium]